MYLNALNKTAINYILFLVLFAFGCSQYDPTFHRPVPPFGMSFVRMVCCAHTARDIQTYFACLFWRVCNEN